MRSKKSPKKTPHKHTLTRLEFEMNEANTENTTRGFVAKRSIEAISPYVAGKPIEETAREYGLDVNTIVKLASNENPLGMPESAVKAALAAASGANRYPPDGNARMFRAAVARHHGVTSDWVIAGNGSDEILSLAARLVLTPRTRCVYSQYSFSVYELSAEENAPSASKCPPRTLRSTSRRCSRQSMRRRALCHHQPEQPHGLRLDQGAGRKLHGPGA